MGTSTDTRSTITTRFVESLGAIAFGIATAFPVTTSATPLALKCVDESGVPVVDLQVDLAARQLRWGLNRYRITQQDERYISAVELVESGRVGGEIWVLDRITGQYTRAVVAILSSRFSSGRPIDPKLKAVTYSGVCKVPVI